MAIELPRAIADYFAADAGLSAEAVAECVTHPRRGVAAHAPLIDPAICPASPQAAWPASRKCRDRLKERPLSTALPGIMEVSFVGVSRHLVR